MLLKVEGKKVVFGKDTVKIIAMTIKNFKDNINLVDKPLAGFQRIDYNFERSPTVGETL